MAHGIKIKRLKADGREMLFISRLQRMELVRLEQINVTKEKRRAIWTLLVSLGYLYILVDRQKYPLVENVKLIYKYYYFPAGWCVFVSAFGFVMALKKHKGEFMKKLDEKGKKILLILTLVLGNDYIFFLSMKMTQINGIESPLDSLELLISYSIIIATAAITIFDIFKTLKE